MAEPITERRSDATRGIDLLDTGSAVRLLLDAQRQAHDAVDADAIAGAVERAASLIAAGGRLAYVGAGTSGRLAEADAAELPPTYGFPADRLVVLRPQTTEEDAETGRAAAAEAGLGRGDVVVAVAASGSTPFVVSAAEAARRRGALVIAMVSNPRSRLGDLADVSVELIAGPEPIAGSTRMKAGLAQKLALTTFSTALMICLGRTFDNLMVEVAPTLSKLLRRRAWIVSEACGLDADRARALLDECGGDVKVAIVSSLAGVDVAGACAALDSTGGVTRRALHRLAVDDA